ncbi:type VII secretion target [Actinophytocola sp.]|uniref:type VII secretion target n=1 Tax=Actinophytocola sp. TaxID=1872138 RepID=UPI00389AF85B
MTADGYGVEIDMVQRHATNVTRIVGQLDPALQAANSQSLPADAFGLIGAELGIGGWLVSPLHDRGVTAVSNAIARAEEIKKTLDSVARSYDSMETDKVTIFGDQERHL